MLEDISICEVTILEACQQRCSLSMRAAIILVIRYRPVVLDRAMLAPTAAFSSHVAVL